MSGTFMKTHLAAMFVVMGTACASEEADGAARTPLPPTTNSELALRNLDAQIEGAQRRYARAPDDVLAARSLVELRLVRSRMQGRFEELDEFLDIASRFTSGVESMRLQASVAAARHRFDEALRLRTDAGDLQGPDLASLLVALGRPEEALERTGRGADLGSELIRAAALSDLGMFVEADRAFVAALEGYTNVSPFIVGDIYFRRGVMWAEKAGRGDLGRMMYETGLRVLPEHVTMNVHLAEIEWEAGQPDRAIARLRAILPSTSDPEVPGLLSEILREEGAIAEADTLVSEASRRYEVLLARHPEAFWDHGSEFFSGPGGEPERGLELALFNLLNRPTERAYLVAVSAAETAGDQARLCALLGELEGRTTHVVELRELVEGHQASCMP